jgi:DNA helicase II / ATP-dependent DNA helicase PcrA
MDDLLAGLNQQQAQAVQTVRGPVLVLAGPGSGKTRVLTRRIAYLIDEAGVAPWNILAVTFTNKAAREMRERVELIFEDKFGKPLPGEPPRLGGLTIGTFHSVCARVLRVETEAVGYQPNWVIYDTGDQLALLRSLLREMNLDEKRYSPQAIREFVGRQKNELVQPGQLPAATYFEEIAGRVYARYQDALRSNNAMDFDDLLTKTTLLLREHEDLRVKYQRKWQYILVDEFQDTNTAQIELVNLLVGKPEGQRNLFAVGDEDQSIYRFRGADYRNVVRFREQYPEATVILLEQNYRSTQVILDVANAVISNNHNRTPKYLHTENGKGLAVTLYEAYNEVEEAAYVCDEIQRLVASRAFDYGDFAVMYRTNAQSRALEEAMVMRQMKYKLVGGTRFYERKEIKDALAFMRMVHNPADRVAMDRVINEPPRGIGAKTYEALKSWAAELGVSEYVALRVLHHGASKVALEEGIELPPAAFAGAGFGKRAEHALVEFAALLEKWIEQNQQDRSRSVTDLLDMIVEDSGYAASLRDGTEDGEDRFNNLQELRGVAAQYQWGMVGLEPGQSPLALFLEEVSLVSDSDALDENARAVTLLTLHTAKGLEYGVVFVVGMEEGTLPHNRSLESGDPEDMDEERRLCYVGITRAKRRLYLLHTFRRSLWGSTEVQQPSRFLDEIPPNLLSGMVDKRSRREHSYQRATSWDMEDDPRLGRPSKPQASVAKGQPSASGSGANAKESYWSPGAARSSSKSGAGSSGKGKTSTGRTPKFKRRDSVQHATFGVGTVIESNVVGSDEEVTVAFPGIGIKKLLASMAGLKKL